MNKFLLNRLVLSRVRGVFAGALIGELLGSQVEDLSREEILKRTDGFGIRGFDHTDIGPDSPGDEWLMTAAVAESLMEVYHFSPRKLVLAQMRAITQNPKKTFGPTTEKSLREMYRYVETDGAEGRSYDAPATSGSCGNGVAGKVSPLALYYFLKAFKNQEWSLVHAREDFLRFGLMTHPDPRAAIAAYAVAEYIMYFLRYRHPEQCYDLIPEFVILNNVCETERLLQKEHPELNWLSDNSFSHSMMRWLDNGLLVQMNDEQAAKIIGTGCFALESVSLALYLALKYRNDFRAGVLAAVNAGGDNDSVASMVGAMIGASVGVHGIPEEWIHHHQLICGLAFDEMADRFFAVFGDHVPLI